jgi:hypothetical protein
VQGRPRRLNSSSPFTGSWRRVQDSVAAILVALGSASTAFASCGGGQISPVVVRSGDWSGQTWKLRAQDSGDGRYGLTVLVAGRRRAALSGRFYVPTRNAGPTDFGWASGVPGTAPAFVFGALTVFAHTLRTVDTIPPRCLFQPDISFFVARIPAGVHPMFFNARNAAGKIVARWRA